jgi:hypothetical protein
VEGTHTQLSTAIQVFGSPASEPYSARLKAGALKRSRWGAAKPVPPGPDRWRFDRSVEGVGDAGDERPDAQGIRVEIQGLRVAQASTARPAMPPHEADLPGCVTLSAL